MLRDTRFDGSTLLTRRDAALRRACALLLLCGGPLLLACRGGKASGRGEGAPSASIISIAVTLGACTDLPQCESECDAGAGDRCRRLAASYAIGSKTVAQDETRAAALYERACDLKDAPGCMFAGQMREFARGVDPDDALAARFYARACDLQWPAGCYNLAIMVERGRGVPADRDKAGELYQIACTAGARQACDKAREMHAPPVPPFLEGGLP